MKLRFASIFISLLVLASFLYGCASQASPAQAFKDIGVHEAFDLIQRNKGNQDFVIIDTRTPGEFDGSHIDGAINVDFYSETFKEDLNKLNRDKTYFIYCRSGNRSGKAMTLMRELGFKEVYNLSPGIQEWIAEGLPVVK